ncbi:trypsin alpha-3-like [Drosophila santomea]|uniref:trypsin alpha-3-like n=1 Tax=Drosophila santomea TaxID=129105 RepID=UPI00195366C0|nr:trypsin alpha-3-like [Drosophila santomea]
MCIQLTLLIASVALISAEWMPERIARPQPVNISKVPWQASILGNKRCGGAILNDRTVLSAAHCVVTGDPKNYSVSVGASTTLKGGQLVKVQSIIRHEGYNKVSNSNDIVILRLSTRLHLGANVQPIPLAESVPSGGSAALVSGWARTKKDRRRPMSQTLLSTSVDIVDQQACTKFYPNKSSVLCATSHGASACRDDSGCPLVSDGKLVGIVSFGVARPHPTYPGGYANVAELRPWILQTIARLV